MQEERSADLNGGEPAAPQARDRSGDALTVFSIVQQLDADKWDWDDNEKGALGDAEGMLGVIKARFQAEGYEFEGLYGIIHDRDWDGDGEHIHVVAKLSAEGGKRAVSLKRAARIAGVEAQYVEKPRSGRYSYDNLLAYLVHAKDPSKFPYHKDRKRNKGVFTAAGEDYADYYEKHKDRWASAREKRRARAAGEGLRGLKERVLSGEVGMREIIGDDKLFRTYSHGRGVIDEALDLYQMRQAQRENEALENGEYRCCVVFLSGQAGTGKTTFARALVGYLEYEYGWDTAHLAAANSLDDYRAERIMLLDDVRFENSMTASSWLNLLDPHHASRSSRRYHNSPFRSKPRVIIITSKLDPTEFFSLARRASKERTEDLDQFIRRITLHVRILDSREFGVHRFELEMPLATGASGLDGVHAGNGGGNLRYELRTPEEYLVGGKRGRYAPWAAIEAVARLIARANTPEGEPCAGNPDAAAAFLEEAYGPIEELAFPDGYAGLSPAIPASVGGSPEIDPDQVAPLKLSERKKLLRKDGYAFTWGEARGDCAQAVHDWATMCGSRESLEEMLGELFADLREALAARCDHLMIEGAEREVLMGMALGPSGDPRESS